MKHRETPFLVHWPGPAGPMVVQYPDLQALVEMANRIQGPHALPIWRDGRQWGELVVHAPGLWEIRRAERGRD